MNPQQIELLDALDCAIEKAPLSAQPNEHWIDKAVIRTSFGVYRLCNNQQALRNFRAKVAIIEHKQRKSNKLADLDIFMRSSKRVSVKLLQSLKGVDITVTNDPVCDWEQIVQRKIKTRGGKIVVFDPRDTLSKALTLKDAWAQGIVIQ